MYTIEHLFALPYRGTDALTVTTHLEAAAAQALGCSAVGEHLLSLPQACLTGLLLIQATALAAPQRNSDEWVDAAILQSSLYTWRSARAGPLVSTQTPAAASRKQQAH